MKEGKIFFIGDSITRGIVRENSAYRVIPDSFVTRFGELVKTEIINLGQFGNNSRRILERLERFGITAGDIVFLQIGGNDCDFNWDIISREPEGDFDPSVPKEDFGKNLSAIFEYLLRRGINTAAINMPPLHPEKYFDFISHGRSPDNILKWLRSKGRIYSHHETFNKILEETAISFGIGIVDIRRRILLSDNYEELVCEDGIHPNAAGHEVIYKEILRFIIGKTFGPRGRAHMLA